MLSEMVYEEFPQKGTEPTGVIEWKPSSQELLVMMTLSALSLMVALDACVIAIVSDLGLSATEGFWIGTAYLLSNAVAMPFIATISDSFGRQASLVVSILLFTVGTLACCLSPSILPMLIGRALQGVGGAGIIVLSLIVFTDIVPLRFRPKWYGIVLAAWALGNCIGPIIGGAIAEKTTWRWVFYIMFPFCAGGLCLTLYLVKSKPPAATLGEKLRKVDWIGGLSLTCSATPFLIAISWGGVQYDWYSTATLVPLALGTIGLVWTVMYETYLVKTSFLRTSLIWSASSAAICVCGAMQGLVIYGQLYYIPFYFLSVKGYTPIETGLAIFPVMFTLVPGSIVTGIMVTRTNNYQYPIWAGWALVTAASGLSIAWDSETTTAVWAITLVILGLGHGAILNAQNFATQAMCTQGGEGHAAAVYAFLRQFGMAVGVSIGGSAFQNVMALKLQWQGLPLDIASNSEGFVAELSKLPAESAYKKSILDAYIYGFHGVYILYTSISAFALLLSFLVKRFSLDKDLSTEHKLQGASVFDYITKKRPHQDAPLDL